MKAKIFVLVIFLQIIDLHYSNSQVLWGMTEYGGLFSNGTIFRMNQDGTDYTVEHSFKSPAGYSPQGNLIQASDGNLYGACRDGGAFMSCTIFRFSPTTSTYVDVHDFNWPGGDFPESGLVEGPGGILYGVAPFGGTDNGVLYKYNMSTQVYTVLHNFWSPTGVVPFGTPIFGNDGKLYGMTSSGGALSKGVIYSYDLSTSTYNNIYDFDGINGAGAIGSLLQADDGLLYGMTCANISLASSGSDTNYDVLFSFNSVGNVYTKLIDFDSTIGSNPYGSLIQSPSGLLYGMTAAGGSYDKGVIFSYDPITTNYTMLYHFDTINGDAPLHDLFLGNDGKLYGTTYGGGINSRGTIFSFDPITLIYTKLKDCGPADGSHPNGSLIYVTTPSMINENKLENSFYVYPNPASTYVNIFSGKFAGENMNFKLLNSQGQIISSWSEKNVPMHYSKSISLEDIPTGIYMLEISDNNARTVIKISKN